MSGEGTVDSSLFEEIPPKLCKSGFEGALFRIGCTDEVRRGRQLVRITRTNYPQNIVIERNIRRQTKNNDC